MGFLSHLFYPWGFLLQIVAAVHFFRRRPETFWIFVIFFGGALGALVYILVEMVPDLRLLGGVYQGFGRRSRIQKLELDIIDNPSAGNYEELGELLLDEKKFAPAREAFSKAISIRDDSPHAFYHRALCALGLGDYPGAIPDLERALATDPRFDFYRAAGLLADAYSRTGQPERAAGWFDLAIQNSNMPETSYNYACFLKSQGRIAEAREWVQKLQAKKRTLPGYRQRVERPWFRKAKTLLKQLDSAGA